MTRQRKSLLAAIRAVAPSQPARRDFESEARANGWMTGQEMHGVDDGSAGVVHPDGKWAPCWESAVSS